MGNDVQVINGITMPPLYNKRAGHMWDIISQHVDFEGERVIDLGCGHGDLLVRTYAAGAREVWGIDQDTECVIDTKRKLEQIDADPKRFYVGQGDIEGVVITDFDIAICCSVLPYIQYPYTFLEYLANQVGILIVECQYAGDGPGVICDDDEMTECLIDCGWSTVTPIGKTFVEGRDKWRTIWKCER